jgi:hypothetical protein
MGWDRCTAIWLPMMHNPMMLTLCWRSLLGVSSDIVAIIFAYTGAQYCADASVPLYSLVNVHDGWPKIVDTTLTVISGMGQGTCNLPFELYRQPILPLWMAVTMQPFDCWMGQTVNCCYSVDAHCSTIVRNFHSVIIDSQITFLCIIFGIQKLREISVAEPPLFPSCVVWIT